MCGVVIGMQEASDAPYVALKIDTKTRPGCLGVQGTWHCRHGWNPVEAVRAPVLLRALGVSLQGSGPLLHPSSV